jgi:hypothetical protein
MTIKICKKHGELTQDEIVKNLKGVIICKKCRNEYSENWRKQNKEKTKNKSIKLRRLAKEGKLTIDCQFHGTVTGNDIRINIRCSKFCGICAREKQLRRYYDDKKLEPVSEYQMLKNIKSEGHCVKHGNNTRSSSGKNPCKICRQESSKRWRERNPEKAKLMIVKIRAKRSRPESIEKRRARIRKRLEADPTGYRKLLAEKAKRYRETFPDGYIKQQIKNQRIFRKDGIKIPIESIPQELVDIKRMHLKLKRTIKENKNGN